MHQVSFPEYGWARLAKVLQRMNALERLCVRFVQWPAKPLSLDFLLDLPCPDRLRDLEISFALTCPNMTICISSAALARLANLDRLHVLLHGAAPQIGLERNAAAGLLPISSRIRDLSIPGLHELLANENVLQLPMLERLTLSTETMDWWLQQRFVSSLQGLRTLFVSLFSSGPSRRRGSVSGAHARFGKA